MPQHAFEGPASDYIEQMGRVCGSQGLPRIAGRMLGFLTLQDQPVSLDDLASALGVSKASVSNDARRLEQLRLIARVSLPADRRDYYTIASDMLEQFLELKLHELDRLLAAIASASELPDTSDVVRQRLTTFGTFQRRINNELLELLRAHRRDNPTRALRSNSL